MTAPRLLKALSEPIRIRIVMLLCHGELCVCDLYEALKIPQSTLSRHMAVLRAAEIVSDRRSGKWVYYALKQSPLSSELIAALTHHLTDIEPYAGDRRTLRDRLGGKRWEELGCG